MKRIVHKIKDKLWVHAAGKTYQIPVSLSKASASSEADLADLIAPFPCKVLKIHVKQGDKVAKNDPVIVVEAMKMEYAYSSPKDGIISKVNVSIGQVVAQGTQFIEWQQKK